MSMAGERKGPLSELVILDLTQFLAGPSATQILGDLGARVIKVEPPEGEMTRRLAPHFHKGESAYYLSVNRNKESVALDLKSEKGREVFLKLAATADAVIENFRPGVAERLGIGFEQLRKVNPHIVMCGISGFGQDGPYRDKPAYDVIVQAISGGMSITGERGGRPVRAGVPLGDLCAGMFGVIGTLATLSKERAQREATYIDVSMLDCQISMLTYQAAYYFMSGDVPGPQDRGHASIPTYRAFTCSDGVEVVVAANTESMWRGLCEAIGMPELIEEERFRLNADRLANQAELAPMLEIAFAKLTAADALERLEKQRVPAGPINDLAAALSDRQVKHREMIAELEDGDGGSIRVAASPLKINGAGGNRAYPPVLGHDNDRVLSELLDLSEHEIDELRAVGAISRRR